VSNPIATRYRYRAKEVLAGIIRVREPLCVGQKNYMNAELVKEALKKIETPMSW
jgi:hypothetical protein